MRPATEADRLSDMKDKNSRKEPKRRHGTSFQVRGVTVISNPGPDAEERLRSLFTLIAKYAIRDAQAAAEKGDAARAEDHDEGEG